MTIERLEGVIHFVADATYDSGALGEKIEDGLSAEALFQASPCRHQAATRPQIYAEWHKVENLFQRVNYFCRIAPRYEKTRFGSIGFGFFVPHSWLR